MDALCDRIAIIKDGRIVSEFRAEELKKSQDAVYTVRFGDAASYQTFKEKDYELTADSQERLKVKVRVPSAKINGFILELSSLQIDAFHKVPFSLEDYFMNFYKNEEVQP